MVDYILKSEVGEKYRKGKKMNGSNKIDHIVARTDVDTQQSRSLSRKEKFLCVQSMILQSMIYFRKERGLLFSDRRGLQGKDPGNWWKWCLLRTISRKLLQRMKEITFICTGQ